MGQDIGAEKVEKSYHDCFKHFVLSETRFEPVKAIEDFVGVKRDSVESWIVGDYRPVGLNKIKLIFLLEAMGFDLPELKDLNKDIVDCIRLVSFDVFSLSDLAKHLDYPQAKHVLRMFFEKIKPIPLRLKRLKELAESYGNFLEEKKQEWPFFNLPEKADQVPIQEAEKTPIESIQAIRDESSEPAFLVPIPRTKAKSGSGLDRNAILDAVANIALGLLPLVEMVVSDEFSPEEMEALRKAAGGDGIFRLSTYLNRLCGERARKHFDREDSE